MSAHRYKVGDRIVLNKGPTGFVSHDGPCRVVSLLPTSFNEPQYRVRFEGENFERCIPESDIDMEKSSRAVPTEGAAHSPGRSTWVTSLATTNKR
jgi:hypothetical protein